MTAVASKSDVSATPKRDIVQRRGPHHRPLLTVLGAVSVGMILDRLVPVPGWVWLTGWCAGLAGWLGVCRVGTARCPNRWGSNRWSPNRWSPIRRQLRRWSACGLLAAAVAAGGGWHHARWRLFRADDLAWGAGPIARPICLEAVALSDPRYRPAPPPDPMRVFPASESSGLPVRAVRLRSGGQWRPVAGTAQLTCRGRLSGIRAGDRLRVFGMLERLDPPANPGATDYAAYARADRRLCRLRVAFPDAVRVVAAGSGWSFRRALQAVRRGGRDALHRYISADRAALAAAILLGVREELNPQRNERFLVTGTMHLLAISGLHVGVLAGGLWWAGRILQIPRRGMLVTVALFVLGYAVLTELRPSVVRAALLIVGWCAGRWLERRAESLHTLAAAALVILLFQPAALFQTGAQLSFVAVTTLVCCRPIAPADAAGDPLARLVRRTRPWPLRGLRAAASGIRRIWLSGAVVWLVTLPLVLDRFHVASFSALALNVVVAVPLTLSLFAGLATLVLAPVAPPLARLAGAACDAALAVMESCLTAAQHLEVGHLWLPGPPGWCLLLFYGLWGAYVLFPMLRPPPRRALAILVAATLCAGLATPGLRQLRYRLGRPPLTLTFIAVGHGTSVLCEFPDGRTLLYDAGSLAAPEVSVDAVSACLWSRGITRLDRLVLSHADADHYNAVPGLLERFRVVVADVSPRMFDRSPPAVAALREALEVAGVPVRSRVAGQQWTTGGVRVRVLHPPAEGVAGSDNANSIVLRLSYQGRHVLLPGDLERVGLERLLALPPRTCDVVLAPHHGSAHSEPKSVARWAKPRWVVVSGGARDATQLVDQLGTSGVRLLHTARQGAIRVQWDAAAIRVRCWGSGKAAGRWVPVPAARTESEAAARGPPPRDFARRRGTFRSLSGYRMGLHGRPAAASWRTGTTTFFLVNDHGGDHG